MLLLSIHRCHLFAVIRNVFTFLLSISKVYPASTFVKVLICSDYATFVDFFSFFGSTVLLSLLRFHLPLSCRASMIWIIGEYAERIDNADELLATFLEGFQDENSQVDFDKFCFPLCPSPC